MSALQERQRWKMERCEGGGFTVPVRGKGFLFFFSLVDWDFIGVGYKPRIEALHNVWWRLKCQLTDTSAAYFIYCILLCNGNRVEINLAWGPRLGHRCWASFSESVGSWATSHSILCIYAVLCVCVCTSMSAQLSCVVMLNLDLLTVS